MTIRNGFGTWSFFKAAFGYWKAIWAGRRNVIWDTEDYGPNWRPYHRVLWDEERSE